MATESWDINFRAVAECSLGDLVKDDFPIFSAGKLIYLDSAATAQKPRPVLEAIDRYHRQFCSNVHRGVYKISERATTLFEETRNKVAKFIGAERADEIIFTRGATESINLVASSWGETFVKAGDEILVSLLEHHSNFVPWQELAKRRGATVKYIGLNSNGTLSLQDFTAKLSARTRLVAITQLANGLGVEPPISQIIEQAHAVGAVVLVDACQAIVHQQVDVGRSAADFLVFSGHKLYGPTGTGVLFARRQLLEMMPPVLFGGEMIKTVAVEGTSFADVPHRFEAGTPNIAGVLGLGAAIDYLTTIGYQRIEAHDRALVGHLEDQLLQIEGLTLLGPPRGHRALVPFTLDGIHPHDLAQFLDTRAIAVRAGHHCAQPLLRALGVSASTRASIGLYNTPADIDALTQGIRDAIKYFR